MTNFKFKNREIKMVMKKRMGENSLKMNIIQMKTKTKKTTSTKN